MYYLSHVTPPTSSLACVLRGLVDSLYKAHYGVFCYWLKGSVEINHAESLVLDQRGRRGHVVRRVEGQVYFGPLRSRTPTAASDVVDGMQIDR